MITVWFCKHGESFSAFVSEIERAVENCGRTVRKLLLIITKITRRREHSGGVPGLVRFAGGFRA